MGLAQRTPGEWEPELRGSASAAGSTHSPLRVLPLGTAWGFPPSVTQERPLSDHGPRTGESGQHSLVWEHRPWTGSGAWVSGQALSSRSCENLGRSMSQPGPHFTAWLRRCSSLVTYHPELELLLRNDGKGDGM